MPPRTATLLRPPVSALLAFVSLAVASCSRPEADAPPIHTVLTEPQVPPGSVFAPDFAPAGLAFSARVDPALPAVAITARHTLSPIFSGRSLALPVPDGADPTGGAGLIAALPLSTATAGGALAVADELGGPLAWLAIPGTGATAPAQLFPVQIGSRRRDLLFFSPGEDTPGLTAAAGAPLLDAAGRAIAVVVGGDVDPDGSRFGIAKPLSPLRPHLVAALATPATRAPGEALAENATQD